jgi:group I intron endonuclease
MSGGTVYVIENLENGKKYIGQTTRVDLTERFREHCGNSTTSVCPKLRNAIKKYGKDCFSVEPLWTSETCDQQELDMKEMDLIEEHNTLNPNGYNLTKGGMGGRHSDETKLLISEKSKQAWNLKGEQYRRERKERGRTEESKQKTSETLKELFKKPELREKISQGNKGKKRSEESKERYRRASQQRIINPEYIRKVKENAMKRNKQVYAFDRQDGLVSIYESLTQTPILTGLSMSSVRKSISTNVFLDNNMRYSYSAEPPPVTAYATAEVCRWLSNSQSSF